MVCDVNDHKTLLCFADNSFNTIFCSRWLKICTHVHLIGQCGHVAMLVLGEVKISGIGNLPICFQYPMTPSSTPSGLAIFVLYISWGMGARFLPKQSGSNVRRLHVAVIQLFAQWVHWPCTCLQGSTCKSKMIHLMLQRGKDHGRMFEKQAVFSNFKGHNMDSIMLLSI